MGVAEWVIVAVVVVGIVFALFGWDRYRSSRKVASKSSQPTGEVFTDPSKASRCGFGTTRQPGSVSTAPNRCRGGSSAYRVGGR